MTDRHLLMPDPVERENLAAFVTNALRLDEAAVIRFRRRGDGRVGAWAATGFDALATRAVHAELTPDDVTAAADVLSAALQQHVPGISLGWAMDSAWRGALPPETGFVQVEDLPARVLVDLAQRGAALAREHSSTQGPPVSLLDQEVLDVDGGGERIGISMRTVFALTAMGFIPHAGPDVADLRNIDSAELVRVRAHRTWLRLDARFGSVVKRRGGDLPLTVSRGGTQ